MFEGIFSSAVLGAGMLAAIATSPFSGASDTIMMKLRAMDDRKTAEMIERMQDSRRGPGNQFSTSSKSNNSGQNGKDNRGRGEKKGAHATTTAAAIACVGGAVTTREQALIAAENTFASAIKGAHTVRASALQTAYTGTNTQTIRASVNSAWDTFNASSKTARKARREAENAAWKAFNSAVKSCKAPGLVEDRGRGGGNDEEKNERD